MEAAAGDGRLRQRGRGPGGLEEAAVGVVVAEKKYRAAAVRSSQKGRMETRESGLDGE
jgi:hypothetical protein